ncbi:MAG TPA: helix-turn-helix domain-containing protein [Thermoanaerobaculia bacterium]|jgi:DNA-binding protein Fis|nr:helix-turn-helix domain-containing protein [Thermoanaerobaculia bacterium]
MEQHLSCSEWVLVLSGPAGPGVDSATAHLAGCGRCWDEVAEAVAELKGRGEPLCFQDARSSIVGVIEAEEKAALRWLLARNAWVRLKSLDSEEQVKRLKAEPTLQTLEMFDPVLAEASKSAPDDPFLGEERYQVAHALAGFFPENICPRPMREDLQGAAMLGVANSRRMAADWTGSASAIEAARLHLARGTGDLAREVRLLSIQASLVSDTGHLEKALSLLAQASEIARRLRNPAVSASLAVQEASTLLAAFRYGDAVSRAEEALGFMGPGETRLEMLARSIITESLIFLERPAEALRSFSSTLPLYEQVAGRRTELLQGYLEALLLDLLGFSREAEKAFQANIAGFMAAEQYKDAFLTVLTYFETLVRKGLLDKAEQVCEEALRLTIQAGSGCHGQLIDLWKDLLALLQTGRLVKHHLVEAREYLVRSWHVPAAQGPLRQTTPTFGLRFPAGEEPDRASSEPEIYEPWIAPKEVFEPESVMIVGGYQEEMERLDRELVSKALAQSRGSIREATRLLGMARDTLRAKLRKYGLKPSGPDSFSVPAADQQVDSTQQEDLRALLDGMRARACWEELVSLPAEQQIRRLETTASLRTPEMLETLLAAARSGAREDPALGEQRAQVAHALAGLLPPSCCSRRRQADLQGDAMLIAAGCRRQAGDFSGSGAALNAATRHYRRGSGDASQMARLLSLQASLAADTGHAKEALDLLAHAAVACRRVRESTVVSIAVQEASTLLGAFRYEEAIAKAKTALRALPPGESRLELLAKSIITESLALLSRSGEALRSLFTSLPLYERLPGHRNELLLGYLEALVLDSLGYAREAEEAFRVNVEGWMEAENYKDALLTLLTWFERLYRRDEIEAAARVCREALRRFEEAAPDRHAHILDLWRNLLALAENQGLTEPKLLEVRDFAMAAFAKKPPRTPEPPASSVPAVRRLHVEPADPVGQLAPGDYRKMLERRDRQLIAAALDQCQGRLRETCRLLGISEPTLREKIKKYGLKG